MKINSVEIPVKFVVVVFIFVTSKLCSKKTAAYSPEAEKGSRVGNSNKIL
jgi:hypothetical protein